jgi:AcrR family transcriptional regulator
MSDEVTDEIMQATYRALCECGYAKLTMQDIADHSAKSKAALHYHYDTKRSLLLAFLDHLFEEFTDTIRGLSDEETATGKLPVLIDAVLSQPDTDLDTNEAFGTAILELKAQAPYDDAIRHRMESFDAFLVDQFREAIEQGIDTGELVDCDATEIARFLVTTIDGARTTAVAVGQDLEWTRRMIHSYVSDVLATQQSANPSRLESE